MNASRCIADIINLDQMATNLFLSTDFLLLKTRKIIFKDITVFSLKKYPKTSGKYKVYKKCHIWVVLRKIRLWTLATKIDKVYLSPNIFQIQLGKMLASLWLQTLECFCVAIPPPLLTLLRAAAKINPFLIFRFTKRGGAKRVCH